jgi:hypothetical protein
MVSSRWFHPLPESDSGEKDWPGESESGWIALSMTDGQDHVRYRESARKSGAAKIKTNQISGWSLALVEAAGNSTKIL